MKKTYNNPSVIIVNVSARTMICGSLDPTNGRGSVSEVSVVEGTAGESRGASFWDDDDE